MRKQLIENESRNPLNIQKNQLNKELKFLIKQAEFIDELSLSYPELCSSIKKYKEEIDYQIDYCNLKIETIDKIIKIHDR